MLRLPHCARVVHVNPSRTHACTQRPTSHLEDAPLQTRQLPASPPNERIHDNLHATVNSTEGRKRMGAGAAKRLAVPTGTRSSGKAPRYSVPPPSVWSLATGCNTPIPVAMAGKRLNAPERRQSWRGHCLHAASGNVARSRSREACATRGQQRAP